MPATTTSTPLPPSAPDRRRLPRTGLNYPVCVAGLSDADTLYTLLFMEEVSARLGWAWEPREVTPGRRPVMEIARIDQRLIGWQAATAAVWVRMRPVVDVALAAVDTVAVVYVMRGAFARHHLLAEARRHLAYALRGRPHEPGLDEQIVQTAVDDHTRPVGVDLGEHAVHMRTDLCLQRLAPAFLEWL